MPSVADMSLGMEHGDVMWAWFLYEGKESKLFFHCSLKVTSDFISQVQNKLLTSLLSMHVD